MEKMEKMEKMEIIETTETTGTASRLTAARRKAPCLEARGLPDQGANSSIKIDKK
jgi:hypothetical protein